METFTINSPLGYLKLSTLNEKLISISFVKTSLHEEEKSLFMCFCIEQINAYFHGKIREFSIPYEFTSGTPFQKNVWNTLTKIPYGKVISYKELAKMVENEKACRAVGNANNKNTLPILIPCHRVIGSNGALVGYEGGILNKQFLLDLEKRHFL